MKTATPITRESAVAAWKQDGAQLDRLTHFGLVRLGKRLVLHKDFTQKIVLTDGVDGFGKCTNVYKVVRIVCDDVIGERTIPTREEWVNGLKSFSHSDAALAPIALQADIDARVAELME